MLLYIKVFLKCHVIWLVLRYCSGSTANCDNITAIRSQLLKNYDKFSIPTTNNTPLNVKVYMYINDMVPLDNSAMHFTIDVFLRLHWKDYRFQFNNSQFKSVPFDYQMLDMVWVPNIYFLQGKNGFKHKLLQQNALLTVDGDGNIIVSERLSLSSYCDMDMKYYPFDIQNCLLHIESYAFNTDYMVLEWEEETGVSGAEDLKTPDFSEVTFKFTTGIASYGKLGDYSRLVIKFRLHRNLAMFILRDFMPCILIVCLSWVGFWINHKVTPARVAFGITTVLTVVTLTNSIRGQAPQSSEFRSIDYFLFFCQLFVFTALGECALIGMAKPEAYEEDEQSNNQTKSLIKRFISPTEIRNVSTAAGKSSNKSDKNENLPIRNKSSMTQFGYHGWKSTENGNIIQVDREQVTSKGYSNWMGKQNIEKKDKEISPTKITKWRIGPVQFHTGDAHIIDRISRLVFPLAFALLCTMYFVFHRMHPDTI